MGYPKDYRHMHIPEVLANFITDVLSKDAPTYTLHCSSREQAHRFRWKAYAILNNHECKHQLTVVDNKLIAIIKGDYV